MLSLTKIEKVTLFEDKPQVTLTSYVAGTSAEMPFNEKRKAVLVIPGGGYSCCSGGGGEPIAHYYLAMGFNAFVLRYTVHANGMEATWPAPLIDASAAMKYIRDHAEELHIDPDYVFVVGFSAGGHLACALGTLWSNDEIEKLLQMEKGYNRPTGMILSYPVISGGEYAHRGSFDNILSERKNDEAAREELSLETRVSRDTVPAFIWSTRPDNVVPVQNSLMFALALTEYDIPFEMHVYPKGGHGASLGNAIVSSGLRSISGWIDDSIRWMNSL